MRTNFARLVIAAACAVCLELLGVFGDSIHAQSSGAPKTGASPGSTTPGTTTPGSTSPGSTSPGTPSSGTPLGGTTPGSTTPGSGTSPGGTSPGTPPGGTTPGGSSPGTGTTPGGGGTGTTPSQPATDPFLVLLQALFETIHQFVVEQFPNASPEFQDWLTGAVMDFYFGDMISEFLFGGSAGLGASGPGR